MGTNNAQKPNRMSGNLRKWVAIIIAAVMYYLIHEGSHLIVALKYGVFEKIRFMGLGVQIVTNIEALSDIQKAIFCVAGSISTLMMAWILVLLTKKFLKSRNNSFKAGCYYVTIAMLFTDPIYLSILYKFFGGGDMNGILLFGISEVIIQAIYGVIGAANAVIFAKYVYPNYKAGFCDNP